jgi:hypothetical protein
VHSNADAPSVNNTSTSTPPAGTVEAVEHARGLLLAEASKAKPDRLKVAAFQSNLESLEKALSRADALAEDGIQAALIEAEGKVVSLTTAAGQQEKTITSLSAQRDALRHENEQLRLRVPSADKWDQQVARLRAEAKAEGEKAAAAKITAIEDAKRASEIRQIRAEIGRSRSSMRSKDPPGADSRSFSKVVKALRQFLKTRDRGQGDAKSWNTGGTSLRDASSRCRLSPGPYSMKMLRLGE